MLPRSRSLNSTWSLLPRCVECRRGLAMRILSVRPSVLQSVCQTRVLWRNERKMCPDVSFSLVFWEEECLVGATPSNWTFGSTGPRWSEIADFKPTFARSASAVTPSKKVQLTLLGSPPRAFQWAYNDRTLPISPPKGSQKCKTAVFPLKSHLAWSLCENCQQRSCKAFIGLTIRAKMIGGGDPFYLKFWVSDRVGAKSPIFDLFSLVSPQP